MSCELYVLEVRWIYCWRSCRVFVGGHVEVVDHVDSLLEVMLKVVCALEVSFIVIQNMVVPLLEVMLKNMVVFIRIGKTVF